MLSDTLSIETSGKGNLREVLEADPEILQLTSRAAMQMSNGDDLGEASDLLKELKLKKQHIIDSHKREKAPHLKAGRDVDRKYRLPKSELTKAIKMLGDTMDQYVAGLERVASSEQIEIDLENARASEEAEKLREESGAEIARPLPKIAAKAPKRVQTGVSCTTFVRERKWAIAEVPIGEEKTIRRDDPRVGNLDDSFFVLDKEAVDRAKKAGQHLPNVEEFVKRRPMTT